MLMEAKLQEIKSRKEAAKLRKSFKAGLEPSAPIPDGIINFLLQNSPSAQVYMVDCWGFNFLKKIVITGFVFVSFCFTFIING
jgi:hypothetical protein